MKKIATLLTLTAIFAMTAMPALAAKNVNKLDVGLSYGTLTGLGTRDLREGVMQIINALLGFLGVVAIVIILYGGFVWLTSAGNEEKVGQAKKILTAGIIGLIIIFLAWAIASFVITSLITATGAA